MTIVIAGGSGMLMDATKWIKEHFDVDIWLLSRNQNKYSEDLLHSKNIHFKQYDYENDNALIDENIRDVNIMVNWVHSNGYFNHLKFIEKHIIVDKHAEPIYVHVVGTNKYDDADFINGLKNKGFNVFTVKLGHRINVDGTKLWLNHEEISKGVIQAIQFKKDILVSD
ncbi:MULTISPECIES: hypothetical protein [Mammaliicoccus]|uniref:Short-chain dehydrogenase n=1 Tax=Mammaliicoccus sciuri TaxID=1296 RepID=A0AAW5LR94_MAMSC|nr:MULTISPECIES: hypothetical protein [Mammaliicoccus]MCQ9304149.1 hypothetical protein [Mammaliicoccus sciuri]MDO0955947.1 hypothetical protein [Mammaliicoccus sciuri]MDT0707547.1 hypothetical protein [Mammaliicoccus sciuri]MDT0754822.1 hypothetical protein [Mammaliicoccus sciuri]